MILNYKSKKPTTEIEALIDLYKAKEGDIKINNEQGAIIHGNNFDSMIELLENYENKIDLVYIDPPFNTNSLFKYNVERTSTISHSANDIVAYSDNLSLEEYFEFIRERLILIHKLLSDKGTLYFHIDYNLGHYIKIILDEVFGVENFINDIARVKSNPKNFNRKAFGNQKDVVYVYAKNKGKHIFNDIRTPLDEDSLNRMFPKKDSLGRHYTTVPCHAPGETNDGPTGSPWKGVMPPKGRHWRSNPKKLDELDEQGLIEWSKNGNPRIKNFAAEHKGMKMQDVWLNYKDPQYPIYPTEKNSKMLDMIVKQSSSKGSLIMDCFSGSGSFLNAGIINKRKVIGIDNSDVAIEVMKQRPLLNELEIINKKL